MEADLLEDAEDVVDAEPGHDVVTRLGSQAAAEKLVGRGQRRERRPGVGEVDRRLGQKPEQERNVRKQLESSEVLNRDIGSDGMLCADFCSGCGQN